MQRHKASCNHVFLWHVDCQQQASKPGLGCMQCGAAARQLLLCIEGYGHHTKTIGKTACSAALHHILYRYMQHPPRPFFSLGVWIQARWSYTESTEQATTCRPPAEIFIRGLSRTDAEGMPQAASSHHRAADEAY